MLTTLAVVVSVGFTVGVLVTTSGLRSTFDNLSEDIYEGVDLAVRPALVFGQQGESGTLVDSGLLDDVRSVDGVAAAIGTVTEFNVIPITAEGKAVTFSGQGPPEIGVGWPDDESIGTYEIWPDGVSRPPTGSEEFVMDADTADENGFEVGERYRVSHSRRHRNLHAGWPFPLWQQRQRHRGRADLGVGHRDRPAVAPQRRAATTASSSDWSPIPRRRRLRQP